MRLSVSQIQSIKITVSEIFGNDASVYLFGSRVHNDMRGGDIDLLVRSGYRGREELERKIKALARLTAILGERKIDLVTTSMDGNDDRLVVHEALKGGVKL